MPDLPRDRPHLYSRKNGRPEPYTSKTPPPRSPLPERDRATHAQAIQSTLDAALSELTFLNSGRQDHSLPDCLSARLQD